MLGVSNIFGKCINFSGLTLALLISPGDARAQDFEVVHAFTGGEDGKSPEAGLVVDNFGKLYGTTVGQTFGGAPGKHCSKSCGTAYDLLQGGVLEVIYSFHGKHGAYPNSPVLIDKRNLYGTTQFGGNKEPPNCRGCGTVYRLTPDGHETVLYAFCKLANCTDGYEPGFGGGLVEDNAGNFYGTTLFGGTTHCNKSVCGSGTVFKLAPNGQETVLYAFCPTRYPSCPDGAIPSSGLVRDNAGNLYGTAQQGGANGEGIVFKIAPNGTETVLHSFCGFCGNDGAFPGYGLAMDSVGNLYGTTGLGGTNNKGTVFKMTTDGVETVLYSFKGGSDGFYPLATVTLDGAGNIYGTTFEGGGETGCGFNTDGCGTVFKLAADGTETVLHIFCSQNNCADGGSPLAVLTLVGGVLYGTTPVGGGTSCNCGTIFRLEE
jgi:uncharacterized repeat protein (TIGR03803 family)